MNKQFPALVAHADWSSDPKKRWVTFARLVGRTYHIDSPEPVGEIGSFLYRATNRSMSGQVVIGFDFPIGLPSSYAKMAGINNFLEMLPNLGRGKWAQFYDIAEEKSQISIYRPFYPLRPGGTSQAHLTSALGVRSIVDLLRKCERRSSNRGNACSLFWTLGGNQVGRAAIIGWRDILGPALRAGDLDFRIWPFQGNMHDLLEKCSCIVVETYPSEACLHLGLKPPGRGWSKRERQDRIRTSHRLFEWAQMRDVILDKKLRNDIQNGFGSSNIGEDLFDSILGLMSMIEVLIGHRPEGAPNDQFTREFEGWIFGQKI